MTSPGLTQLLGAWEFDPGLVTALAAGAALYLVGVRRTRRPARGPADQPRARRWSRWRTTAFLGGLAAVELALQSGLDYYGDRLLSVHMAGHLVLMLLAAPLLLLGAPVELALRTLPSPSRRALARTLHRPAVRALMHPVTGLVAFSAAAFGTHLTPVYALALTDPTIHAVEHVAYLASALLFWAVVIPPGPVGARLSGPGRPGARLGGLGRSGARLAGLGRIGYVLLSMPIMSVVAVVLGSGASVRYAPYVSRSSAFGVSALGDQRVASAVMWVGGSMAVTAVALAVAWRAMLDEERRERRREAVLDRREAVAATAPRLPGGAT